MSVEKLAENSTTNSKPKRGEHLKPHRFKKGVSGNPAGRPKILDVVKQMCAEATPEAVEFAIATMRNEKESTKIRLEACDRIVQWAGVTPKQIEASESAKDGNITLNVLHITRDEAAKAQGDTATIRQIDG